MKDGKQEGNLNGLLLSETGCYGDREDATRQRLSGMGAGLVGVDLSIFGAV